MTADPLARRWLDILKTALERHDLRVSADYEAAVLVVKNPEAATQDPAGQVLHPGLSQRVALRQVDGVLMWCWIWEAPRPAQCGVPTPAPEIEPMCAVDDLDFAAERIAKVLATTGPGPGHA